MGIFGGSKSSSNVVNQTETNVLQPTLDSPSGATIAGNQGDTSVNYSVTDAGATQQALESNQAVTLASLQAQHDTAYSALAQSDHTLGESLAFALDTVKTAAGASTQSVLGTVASQGLAQQETTQKIGQMIMWAAIIIAGAYTLPKLLKG